MNKKRMPESENCNNPKSGKQSHIKVRVGYGWQKFEGEESERYGKDVLYDTFWQSLRQTYKPICAKFKESKDGHGITVALGRLRAKHGCLVWPTIAERIIDADILIFDVAAAPAKDISNESGKLEDFVEELNSNVLLEIGYALGCGKRVILMCPTNLFEKVPSDLRGFFWTQYAGHIENGKLVRTLADVSGTINAFRGMLREVAKEKAGVVDDDD